MKRLFSDPGWRTLRAYCVPEGYFAKFAVEPGGSAAVIFTMPPPFPHGSLLHGEAPVLSVTRGKKRRAKESR